MSYESVEMKNERKDIMAEERVEPKPIDLGEYKFGFHDDVEPVLSTGKGLNEDVIRELSAAKGEPEWMLEFRLKSYETFKKMPMQTWGADLSEIDFDDLIYYQKPSDKPARSWDEVPEKIKETFERIGIPEAERAYLAGGLCPVRVRSGLPQHEGRVPKIGDYLYRYGFCPQGIPRLV